MAVAASQVLRHFLPRKSSSTLSPISVFFSLGFRLYPGSCSSRPEVRLLRNRSSSRYTLCPSFCASSNREIDTAFLEDKESPADERDADVKNTVDEEIDPTFLEDEESSAENTADVKSRSPAPVLSVKEKKELASFAHGLGDKLKCQMVGKSGVTGNVAISFVETLEANELLKIKIHRTCPGEVDEVVQQLQEATGSVAVSKIGRTVIIYRPSLTKMKAEEEKKKITRKPYRRRDWQPKPPSKSPVRSKRIRTRA